MYVRLVSEAVETFKGLMSGEPVDATDKGPKEIRVDLPVDAHIPETYINSERLRLEVYRKLAEARDDDALTAAADDMINPPVYYDDDGTDVLSYFESSHRRLNATDASLSYLIDHTKLSEYDASQWCVFLLVVMVAPVVAGITCAIFHTNTFY
jgi:transcription-repair coupling factor (superfamily II helicase)